MTVHLYQHELSYFSVPKCACTSLKTFFFEIENGFEFKPFHANGRSKHIHNAAYPSRPFTAWSGRDLTQKNRLAVVRHPIGRVLSCYTNRVLHHRELSNITLTDAMIARGVVPDPDLSTFIRFLPAYRKVSPSIRHHSEPLSHFLGPDPALFTGLFPMSRISEFVAQVAEIVGPVPELQQMQKSRDQDRVSESDLSPAERNRIENLLAEDLEIFGRWFE